MPADGPGSWTTREDAAEAAAVILESNGAYDGPVTLTAPDAPTFVEVAGIASEVSGRDVVGVVQPRDEWLAGQIAAGTEEFMAGVLLGRYDAAAEGRFAGTDPLLGELLGRAPRSVADRLAA